MLFTERGDTRRTRYETKVMVLGVSHIEFEVSLRHLGEDDRQRDGRICLELGILGNLKS